MSDVMDQLRHQTLERAMTLPEPRVSLLFPAFNRLEFTKQAWAALQANTDWSLVKELHVYDDGSTDGTREWLLTRPSFVPATVHLTNYRSPMGVTIDWLRCARAPILAKLDNDTVYPPGWLNVAISVLDRYPALDCLGLEAMRVVKWPAAVPVFDQRRMREAGRLTLPVCEEYGYLPAQFVSGLGLYRSSAFERSVPQDGGYFGLEEWQVANRKLRAGWILPSLPVFLLDRLPIEPWRSLSERYVREGWQREWSGAGPLRYKESESDKWSWWTPYEEQSSEASDRERGRFQPDAGV